MVSVHSPQAQPQKENETMKKMGEMLLTRRPFSEIVMGNTALVRAMIESGTRVVTSYPGSPTPEIAAAIAALPSEERPFYFEFSTNEKVATEVAYGAAVNGHLSTVFFKSVGLNVAADTFVQLNLMNIIGGMVVVLGDDPGANSSQNEQDNRHYAHLSYTPVFEPADPGEAYTFYKAAAKLAQEQRMAVILRLTTHVCHAKAKIQFEGWDPHPLDKTPRFGPGQRALHPHRRPCLPHERAGAEEARRGGCLCGRDRVQSGERRAQAAGASSPPVSPPCRPNRCWRGSMKLRGAQAGALLPPGQGDGDRFPEDPRGGLCAGGVGQPHGDGGQSPGL